MAEGQDALGNAALHSENYALAMQSAQEAARLAPYWVPAKLLLARATIASGREEEGLAMARDLALAPDADVATHMEYALVLASTGHDEEARAILTPYATGTMVVPAAVRTLGMLDLQSDDLKGANARFEELLSMGSQSYDALYYLGVVAERRDDQEGAIRYYSRVTGGDQAIAAQQRVAIHEGEEGRRGCRPRVPGAVRPCKEPSLGPRVVMARAGLLSSMDDDKRALACSTRASRSTRRCWTCGSPASSPTSASAVATPRCASFASCSRRGRATRWCRTRSATRSRIRTGISPRRARS